MIIMIYQILPKHDYIFHYEEMEMFLKTGMKKNYSLVQNLKSMFDADGIPLDYQFIIDCDDSQGDSGISFYLQIKNEKAATVVFNSLENMFQDKADVFPIDHKLERYTTVHTLYTVDEYEADGKTLKQLSVFKDDQAFLFILGTMKNKTRITVDFSVDRCYQPKRNLFKTNADIKADVMIKVSAKTKYQRNEVLEITNTVISLTAGSREFKARYRDIYRTSKLNGYELMDLMRLPSLSKKSDNLEVVKRIHKLEIGQRTLKSSELSSGIKCGKVYHPMQDRDVYLNVNQLRKHMFITGQTGSGKSSVAEEMIKDILEKKVKGQKNVPGLTFFDPAETSVLGVIDILLKLEADGYDISEVKEMIHYIDFGYDDFIFPISLLNKDIPSTEILDFFKALFGDSATIQVDRLVTGAINALLMDDKEHTISDVPALFQNEEMRQSLFARMNKNIYAEDVKSFLNRKFNPQQIEPILNRTDPFLNTDKKKLMFGMTSQFDGMKKIKNWIDEGHIILFNLKGLNNNDNRIIVGYIALKYYLFGLQRNDNALLHLTFMDESHKLQFDILQRWLAELRKSGLALVPMTQYLDQYNPEYLQALLGNVGTKITFRQGDDAARRLVNNLPGNLDRDSLKRLPDMRGYVSTEDQKVNKSVLISVSPPYRYTDGKAVPYPDPNNVATNKNIKKNRTFARKLMERDFMSKQEAERIVFHKYFAKEDQLQTEAELLEEGDSLWDE